jgi:hypothetical protein
LSSYVNAEVAREMRNQTHLFVGVIFASALAASIVSLRNLGPDNQRDNPIFTDNTIDVGNILRASTVECDFHFRSDMDIDRDQLTTVCSCGCLQTKAAKNGQPQETLTIVYTASRRLGSFRKECYVQRGADTLVVLAIKGTIVSEIELLPNQLVFDSSPEGDHISQTLRIRRVGLSKEEFRAIDFRLASPAIAVSEASRSDEVILLHCDANTTTPAEIEQGFYCELNSADGKKTLAHVPCKYRGPVLRPSVAVFRAEARQRDEQHVFRLVGDRAQTIRRLHLDSDLGEQFLDLAFENNAHEGPALTITIPKDVLIPVSVHHVQVYFAEHGGGDERRISLPIRFF